MLNLPILPILICIPLIGLIFILLSSENDDFALQSKRSALWTSASNFMLSLYLPFNFDKDIPHFQFVNSFEWFNSENLKFSLGVDGLSMPFIVLSTFLKESLSNQFPPSSLDDRYFYYNSLLLILLIL